MTTERAEKVLIVGIGDDGMHGLSAEALRRVADADLVLGHESNLALAADTRAEKVPIGSDPADLVRTIERARQKKIVVLASGDPLFYGFTRFLIERLGKDRFEVLPHVSTMQLAFARVMESWEDAYLANVDEQPMEMLLERIRSAETVGLFTSADLPPEKIASALIEQAIDYFRVYVCENLGSRNEVVTQGTLAEIAEMEFSPLNVMILVRRPGAPDSPRLATERKLFGNPDELFRQSRPKRGLLTPAEVRTLALAQLDIRPKSVVWDVGAGSGSISVEAAQLAHAGQVYAIEPDMEDRRLIAENASMFGVANVVTAAGRAPDIFSTLPDPDCVFVGGTGRETVGILESAHDRLKPGGRLVANVTTLENVSAATSTLKRITGHHVGVLMINLARGVHQLQSIRFSAVNPSFLVFVTKGGAGSRRDH